MELLKFNSVSKRYSPQEESLALSGINLTLMTGSFAAVTGPSGSGKTTFLNIAAGLDNPSSGWVSILGNRYDSMDLVQRAKFRLKNMGFVFQAYNLLPVLSARENVELSSLLRGMTQAESKKIALEALEKVGLKNFVDKKPSLLSGGQQQRVAVARAIAGSPSLIFADEPTANLDTENAMQLINLFKQLNKENGISFMFSTHDHRLINQVDLCIHMKDGTIQQL